jgi:hypothetical protein
VIVVAAHADPSVIERIHGIRTDRLDPGAGALHGHHLDLDEQLRPREAHDAAAHRRGSAAGKVRRALTGRTIHLRAIDTERLAPDDVVEGCAHLIQRPAHGFERVVVLGRPVVRRLDLAGRIEVHPLM